MAKLAALGLLAAGFALAACVSAEPPPAAVVDAGEAEASTADAGADSGPAVIKPTKCALALDEKFDAESALQPNEWFDSRDIALTAASSTWTNSVKPTVALSAKPVAGTRFALSSGLPESCRLINFDGVSTLESSIGITETDPTRWNAPTGSAAGTPKGTTIITVVRLETPSPAATQETFFSRLAVSRPFKGIQFVAAYGTKPNDPIGISAFIFATNAGNQVESVAELKQVNGIRAGLHIVSIVASNDLAELYLDDRPVINSQLLEKFDDVIYETSLASEGPLVIGGSNANAKFRGGVGMVAIYTQPLSPAALERNHQRLMKEWGIPNSK